MNNKIYFSLDNFKKWIDDGSPVEPESNNESVPDTLGQSKISYKKLLAKINTQEGEPEDICKEFIENGGKIVEQDSKRYLIETESGSFYLHRMYVEIV